MGLFNKLMSKIFGHAEPAQTSGTSQPAAAPAPATGAGPAGAAAGATAGGAATAAAATTSAPPPQPVDVAAILNKLAAENPEKLDWKNSIVDLMKLVGMDSSFGARKELAKDLHYSGDMNDSAKMNVWLHKEVLRKLAENGGKVPSDLLR